MFGYITAMCYVYSPAFLARLIEMVNNKGYGVDELEMQIGCFRFGGVMVLNVTGDWRLN